MCIKITHQECVYWTKKYISMYVKHRLIPVLCVCLCAVYLTICSIFFLYLASIWFLYSGRSNMAAKLKEEFFSPARWHSITVDVNIGTMSEGTKDTLHVYRCKQLIGIYARGLNVHSQFLISYRIKHVHAQQFWYHKKLQVSINNVPFLNALQV